MWVGQWSPRMVEFVSGAGHYSTQGGPGRLVRFLHLSYAGGRHGTAPRRGQVPTMDPKTIVVVEDNEPIARLIREVLNEVPGYGAVALANSALAPALIAAVRADLVILDIDLPGLSGLELYDRLRDRPETADIPVLFMSATAHREELARRGRRRCGRTATTCSCGPGRPSRSSARRSRRSPSRCWCSP